MSQGVTAAFSGKHTNASAGSRRLAWRSLARPSAGQRSYRRGAAEIPAGVSVTGRVDLRLSFFCSGGGIDVQMVASTNFAFVRTQEKKLDM